MSTLLRGRTFAIISHADIGETTLTEKLLLFGGRSSWRGDEGARRAAAGALGLDGGRVPAGISVSSAMMSFEHEGLPFNLLDTPGHQDFSEDTYRTLTAIAMPPSPLAGRDPNAANHSG